MRYFVTILALLVSSETLACMCDHPSAADESLVLEHADVVFVGEVVEVAMTVRNGIEVVDAKFRVLEDRKAAGSKFIFIQVRHGGTSCDLMSADFRPGERYLISGSKIRFADPKRAAAAGEDVSTKRYYNNFCDLRERLAVTPNKSLERTREG